MQNNTTSTLLHATNSSSSQGEVKDSTSSIPRYEKDFKLLSNIVETRIKEPRFLFSSLNWFSTTGLVFLLSAFKALNEVLIYQNF